MLEYRYLRDVERAHGLPRSRHQVRVVIAGQAAYRDAYYDEYQLAVELDGRLAHGMMSAGATAAGTTGQASRVANIKEPDAERPFGHSPGRPDCFTAIASTRTAGSASHYLRLGESGTPSLVCCPEPGPVP